MQAGVIATGAAATIVLPPIALFAVPAALAMAAAEEGIERASLKIEGSLSDVLQMLNFRAYQSIQRES
jgi:hypothetical protein